MERGFMMTAGTLKELTNFNPCTDERKPHFDGMVITAGGGGGRTRGEDANEYLDAAAGGGRVARNRLQFTDGFDRDGDATRRVPAPVYQ